LGPLVDRKQGSGIEWKLQVLAAILTASGPDSELEGLAAHAAGLTIES